MSRLIVLLVFDGLFLVFSYSTKYGPQDFNVRMWSFCMCIHMGALGLYHWQEVFVAAKEVFCHDKSMIVTTNLFYQTYFCHDKTSVVTNIYCDKHNFDATKVLSRQAYFCRDKTCLLLWQKYACCNKTFVATNMCLSQHMFVVTKLLSWQSHFTMMLVAASANDRFTISSEGLL